MTSSGVTGWRSENFAAGLSVNVTDLPVIRHVDRFGEQPIERERLVEAAGHQALDDKFPDARRRYALDDERVQVLERAKDAERQPAAFRGRWIDVGKGFEIIRKERAAMKRDGMAGRGAGRSAADEHQVQWPRSAANFTNGIFGT